MEHGKDDKDPAQWWPELVKIVPAVLWVVLALYALSVFRDPILTALSRQEVTKIGVPIFQIEFARQEIAQIERPSAPKTPEEFKPFEERIKRDFPKISGANVLWVDNHPEENIREIQAFAALGVRFDIAHNTADGMKMVNRGTSYDLIITDMDRRDDGGNVYDCFKLGDVKSQGCEFIHQLYSQLHDRMPPTIIYMMGYDPSIGTPSYAFGITDRVDHFVQLVLDALERRKVE